ncbi:CsgG/HfaB family protein [Ruixingdingia sedimenti]|uniref:CsgG/HfaB family protein n=1 Tax=Ruixingdingia sedimenti TaxID=3073604 RepID=A0ABU1F8J9_9RHOB|nr:CsgG/HfaB family protein [Xinfangfangia sp. LG-4]MDR5653205.1 CsgG/HfaB family protein [Xinfangfangia sp. LG-4]
MITLPARFLRPAALLLGALALAGCDELVSKSLVEHPATVTRITEQNLQLRLMPAPARRITVSVYDLPDLTGQFRERDTVQSLSRAVSQGGGPMLIKALQDAGERRWFSVLDRTALDNLLRERQIVTEMRRLYRGEQEPDPTAIPPLHHAGIIIQGAIVGYDSNTQTGGFGARYLGVGGDQQWKLDIVTVALRAVSSDTGEVLASVMVDKPVASTALRGGIFSYIEMDKLLEVETGVAANEPKQLAVQMAVEKAVFGLILEGADVGIWDFADRKAGQDLLKLYRAEKYRGTTVRTDVSLAMPPDTRNPARVVPTRPAARPDPRTSALPPVQERVLPPAATAAPPAPPPAASADETIG